MERRTRSQSLQHHNSTTPRVPLTPEEIAQVKALVQYNKAHFAKLLEMFSRAVHQFNAICQRTQGNRAIIPSAPAGEQNHLLRSSEASTAMRQQSPLGSQRQMQRKC